MQDVNESDNEETKKLSEHGIINLISEQNRDYV